MRKYFPTYNIRNVANYYYLIFFSSHWFVAGNWTFFFLKLMTYGELGLSDGVAFAIGVLAEVPSGAIADLMGKKRTLVSAKVLMFLSMLITGIAGDKWQIFTATIMFAVAQALYSGAAEALLYDSMKDKQAEQHFDLVSSRIYIIDIIMTAITSIVGGLIFIISPRGPFLAAAAMAFVAILVSLRFNEPKVDSEKFSWRNYLRQLKVGSFQLTHTDLKKFLPMLLVIGAAYYMFNIGYIRLSMGQYFGFDGSAQSLILGIITILTAVALSQFTIIRKRLGDYRGIKTVLAILAVSFLVSTFNLGLAGLIVLFAISIAGSVANPWTSVIINAKVESKYRATALSAYALLIKAPYPLIAIMGGAIVESGRLGTFNLVVGLLLLAVLGYQFLPKNAN